MKREVEQERLEEKDCQVCTSVLTYMGLVLRCTSSLPSLAEEEEIPLDLEKHISTF